MTAERRQRPADEREARRARTPPALRRACRAATPRPPRAAPGSHHCAGASGPRARRAAVPLPGSARDAAARVPLRSRAPRAAPPRGRRARPPLRPVACSPPPRTARRRARGRDPAPAPARGGRFQLEIPRHRDAIRLDAECGKALRVGLAASAHRAQAFEAAAHQRRDLLVARQAALRDAPRDDHHRNVTARGGRDPARPEFRLDQYQRCRRDARERRFGTPRVVEWRIAERNVGPRAGEDGATRRRRWWTPAPRDRAGAARPAAASPRGSRRRSRRAPTRRPPRAARASRGARRNRRARPASPAAPRPRSAPAPASRAPRRRA